MNFPLTNRWLVSYIELDKTPFYKAFGYVQTWFRQDSAISAEVLPAIYSIH